jgi:hypothetical protein
MIRKEEGRKYLLCEEKEEEYDIGEGLQCR